MESPVSRLVLLVCLAAGFALALALPAAGSTTRMLSASARAAQARLIASEALSSLADKAGPSDSQWYADGVWHSKDKACWFCATGPATLAATLWRVNGRTDPRLFKKAVATFDRTIAAKRNSNGSFGEQSLPNTQFFGVELGTTYLLLGNRLGPKHRVAWRKSISGAADYLIRHGDLTWATNGNINLGNTELEWLAWAITGKQRFRNAYELSWRYTIHPSQTRWRGYGLHITREATGTKGAGLGAGYLAESGGKRPGFDPEYTMLQLSVASRAYLLSHDPRFRWLANMLWNQLSPLVKRPAWTLDARNGTRRSNLDMLTTPGMAVLATAGGRNDLLPSLDSQISTRHVHDVPAERAAELGQREHLPAATATSSASPCSRWPALPRRACDSRRRSAVRCPAATRAVSPRSSHLPACASRGTPSTPTGVIATRSTCSWTDAS